MASGVVLLGTHLATALTAKTTNVAQADTTSTVPILGAASSYAAPALGGHMSLSPDISLAVNSVAESMVTIQANFGAKQSYMDGLVISQNGLIVAPATSVAGAASIIVTLYNKTSYVGNIVGIDNSKPYNSDLAVIHIEANGLHPVPLDEEEPVANHQMVLALNIQAAKEQVLATTINSLDSPQTKNWSRLVDSIVISPTPQGLTPGTAILDDAGGVVAFVLGNNQKYPIAVPAWLIKPVTNVLIMHKTVLKGWLGVVATNYTLRKGVLIDSVYRHSAAAAYGLLPGDVIIALDNQPTDTVNSLMARLYTKPPGSTVRLLVIRGNKIMPMKLVLGSSTASK